MTTGGPYQSAVNILDDCLRYKEKESHVIAVRLQESGVHPQLVEQLTSMSIAATVARAALTTVCRKRVQVDLDELAEEAKDMLLTRDAVEFAQAQFERRKDKGIEVLNFVRHDDVTRLAGHFLQWSMPKVTMQGERAAAKRSILPAYIVNDSIRRIETIIRNESEDCGCRKEDVYKDREMQFLAIVQRETEWRLREIIPDREYCFDPCMIAMAGLRQMQRKLFKKVLSPLPLHLAEDDE
jgi:hypothetical protein